MLMNVKIMLMNVTILRQTKFFFLPMLGALETVDQIVLADFVEGLFDI
jgi:hypothetical protein